MEDILEALKTLGIDIYCITETETESEERFYVRRELDQCRGTKTLDRRVMVYAPVEDGDRRKLGESPVQLPPDMDPGEMRAALERARYAASLAGNPWYELPKGKKEAPVPATGGFAGKTLSESRQLMEQALFAVPDSEDAFINSAEIFMRRVRRRVVNSNGVDVEYERYTVDGEYVIQSLSPQDVETHHTFFYTEPETEALRLDVEESMEVTKARARAVSAPETGEYALILSGEQIGEFMSYYLERANTAAVYQKFSDFAVGDNVQGEDIQGDRLNVELAAKTPYSAEGIAMRDRPLMENGVLKTLHGGARFSWYLGRTPIGEYSAVRVPAGRVPAEELRRGKCLHVLSFSDFQMDQFSGHFGGEIRLAILYDGETATPVTGGSVSGSILDAQKRLTFSRELYSGAGYEGPKGLRIEGVRVAGI